MHFLNAVQLKHESFQVKEQAKKRNLELLGDQNLLISSGKQLQHEAAQQFGAQIKETTDRMESLEKEIEDMRQEIVEIEDETRCAKSP